MQYDLLNSNLSAAYETKLGGRGSGLVRELVGGRSAQVGRTVAILAFWPFGPFPERRGVVRMWAAYMTSKH